MLVRVNLFPSRLLSCDQLLIRITLKETFRLRGLWEIICSREPCCAHILQVFVFWMRIIIWGRYLELIKGLNLKTIERLQQSWFIVTIAWGTLHCFAADSCLSLFVSQIISPFVLIFSPYRELYLWGSITCFLIIPKLRCVVSR